MKVKAFDLHRRVITVSDYIVSFYLVNPTELRYKRCKKIIDGLKMVNDELVDNKYRHDNWSMLMTASQILTNVGVLIFDAKTERLIAPDYRNRKVTIVCSSNSFKRLRPAE